MANKALHRHDISDAAWKKLEPLLLGRREIYRRPAEDNRRFINAVQWIHRTGAPWRDLPPCYGDWKNTHRRFCRWRDAGAWEKIHLRFTEGADLEWFMIDSACIKVHPNATGIRGDNQVMSRTKGSSLPNCILV
ncbi:MAG: IS5 family transposase [Puniceicoccales bacterium]|nr:IS5 family transposase [Puniceicoccales bacterium]